MGLKKRKKLIINADGFGFTPGVNKGILEAVDKGIVTSTSCVVNFGSIKEVEYLAKNYPHISIGIHFNLSVGKPVTNPRYIPSLVNSSGEFWGSKNFIKRILTGRIRGKDILLELENQAKLLLDFVPEITHFDGHQNKHLFPQFLKGAVIIAQKFNIQRMRSHRRFIFTLDIKNRKVKLFKYYLKHPQRIITHGFARLFTDLVNKVGIRTPDRLISPAYADTSKKYILDTWLKIFEFLPEGINEIYCHPGYVDEILRKYALYVAERPKEVEILTSRVVKEAVEKNQVELISFYQI